MSTRSRVLAVLLVAAATVVGLPSPPADAARVPDLECGVNPTTSVRLRQDLTCSAFFTLPSTNPAITIDLGGHTLSFDADPPCDRRWSFASCGIADQSGLATIRNGTVDGDVTIGSTYHTDSPGPATVSRVHVTERLEIWAPTTVTNSVIDGWVGLQSSARIERNTIRGGIRRNDTQRGGFVEIIDNDIVGSPAAGIDLYHRFVLGGSISGNYIAGSAGPGIDINGYGEVNELDIVDNRIVGNGGDGISYLPIYEGYPEFRGPVRLRGNVVRRNGGQGIDIQADPLHGHQANPLPPVEGVFDGGGNVARFNGAEPQCLLVRCEPDARAVPIISWPRPDTIFTGTPLGPDELDATATVPGTFSYEPAAGTILAYGPHNLRVRFVPDDPARYQSVSWGTRLFVASSTSVPR